MAGESSVAEEEIKSKGNFLSRTLNRFKGYFVGLPEGGAVPIEQYRANQFGEKVEGATDKVIQTTAALGAAASISVAAPGIPTVANEIGHDISSTATAVGASTGEFAGKVGARANDAINQAINGPDLAGPVSRDIAARNASVKQKDMQSANQNPLLVSKIPK